MIETAQAVRFSGEVEQGRTQPLRAFVELPDESRTEVVLKPTSQPHLTTEGLANEILGSLLAGDLDLPTPRPMFVELSPDFIDTIPDPRIQARFRGANPVAFASTHAGSQWRRWDPIDHVSKDRLQLALRIFAFDAFIGNPDRGPKNSNLLRHKSDGAILLIDHETAFGFRMKLFPRVEPWNLGNLSHMANRGADSEHVFFSALAGREDVDFQAIVAPWADLSDARLAAYDAQLPDAWEEARPAFLEALSHLRMVRDRIGDCVNEIRRVLR